MRGRDIQFRADPAEIAPIDRAIVGTIILRSLLKIEWVGALVVGDQIIEIVSRKEYIIVIAVARSIREEIIQFVG